MGRKNYLIGVTHGIDKNLRSGYSFLKKRVVRHGWGKPFSEKATSQSDVRSLLITRLLGHGFRCENHTLFHVSPIKIFLREGGGMFSDEMNNSRFGKMIFLKRGYTPLFCEMLSEVVIDRYAKILSLHN